MLLLVLAAMPALTLIVYSSFAQRAASESHAREAIANLVKLAAEQQAQTIEGAKQLLVGFSLVPSSLRDDQARCNEYVEQVLKKTPRLYLSMGLYGSNGEIRCSGTPGNRAVQHALEHGMFSIGEYQSAPLTKPDGITVSYPIADAERGITGVAFIVLNLLEFDRVAMKLPLPQAGVLTVIDRNGVVLARNPRRADVIGQKLEVLHFPQKGLSGSNGVFYANDVDGTAQLVAHESVVDNPGDSASLRVLVSIPLSVIHAEADETLLRNLIGAIVVTLLLLIAAWYGAEFFFLRNVRTLLDTAKRVRAGDLGARTGMRYGNEELSQIAKAFDEMAEALQERQKGIESAMENLHKQAITDPLTGMNNRRYLYELLPREIMRAKRSGATMGLIIIDLDHFKGINDALGHEAGDLALREVGALLMKGVRGSDIVCRYGGEEFCVALPDAGLATAQSKAEEIRLALERLALNYCGKPLRISASFGVAVYPQHGTDADSLLRAADEALYEAKKAGRNRVMVHAKDSVLREVRMGFPVNERSSVVPAAADTVSAGVSDIKMNTAARRTQNQPLRPVETAGKSERPAAIQILTGPLVGKEIPLVNNATTVGKKGDEIAIITRTSQGYFITHLEGPKFPVVNGSTIESRARPLNDRDVIELAGVKMAFFYK